MMKRSLILVSMAAASVQGFVPLSSSSVPRSTALNNNGLVGDFYGDLNRFNNQWDSAIPAYNNFWPKSPKKLKGSFYKELNTQLEMKIPKPSAAAEQLPLPEQAMVQPPPAAVAPPAVPAQPAAPPAVPQQ